MSSLSLTKSKNVLTKFVCNTAVFEHVNPCFLLVSRSLVQFR